MFQHDVTELPAAIKKIAIDKGIDLTLTLPMSEIQHLETLAMMKGGSVRLTLVSDQQPLPSVKGGEKHPGQMGIHDELGDNSNAAALYFVRLMEIPTDLALLKKAEQALKKITGLDLAGVREALLSLPWDLTIATKDGPADAVFELQAVEIREQLMELGCVVSMVRHGEPRFVDAELVEDVEMVDQTQETGQAPELLALPEPSVTETEEAAA